MVHAALLESLQIHIGHDFGDLSLLERALIAGDTNSDDKEGHRGLAQLGDSLIGTVIFSEGLRRGLSRKVLQDANSRMRSKSECVTLARCLKLDQYVTMTLVGATWLDTFNYNIVVRVMNCMGLLNYPALSSFEDCMTDDTTNDTLADLGLLEPFEIDLSLLTENVDLFSGASTVVPPTWSVDDGSPIETARDTVEVAASFGVSANGKAAMFDLRSVNSYQVPAEQTGQSCMAKGSPNAIVTSVPDAGRLSLSSSARLSKNGKIVKPQPKLRRNSAKYVIQEYVRSEMNKRQSQSTSFQQMMSSYEWLIFKAPTAQQASMAYFVTSMGDSSGLLLLKEALKSLRDPDASSCLDVDVPMSITQRLLAIDRTGSLTSQIRLVHWLHILSLHDQLHQSESVDGFVNSFSATMRPAPSAQDRPSQSLAQEGEEHIKVDPRLRRFGKRLALLVHVWGRGVLLLLGHRFTEERFMSPTDKVFDELLGLLNRQEGSSIMALSGVAEPIVKAFQKRDLAAPRLVLEEADDDDIRQLPRLSEQFSKLLTPVLIGSSSASVMA